MRLRNIPGAEEALANSRYVIKQPETYRGKFKEQIFQNENPNGKREILAGYGTEKPGYQLYRD